MRGVIMENNKVNISYLSKKIPQKIKLIKLGAAILIVACSFSFLVACGAKESVVNSIPDNQIEYTIKYNVKDGDTLFDISKMFFDEDCENVYNSFNDYLASIRNDNNLSNSHIEPNDVLNIPVIIDSNNEYYLRVLEIENKIEELKNNNLWINHTVKYGETISYYAALASTNYEETLMIASDIRQKNNLSNNNIQEGSTILIMNPELGNLKLELNEAQLELYNSLVGNNKTK